MAEQAEQVSTNGLVDTKRPGRRQYSETLKRQMVAETQAPGASVSVVARRHDVNSNQLFRWRRPPRRSGQAAVVGRRRAVPVRQASGARAIRLAVGRGGRGGAEPGATLDAARGDRLADAAANLAARAGRLSVGWRQAAAN